MGLSIAEAAQEIVEEFSMFDDWMDKYQYLIEMGQDLNSLPESKKSEDNIVHGCQSRVWLAADHQGDKVHFSADSDAIITKGLIAMLMRVLSDQRPQEILNAELDFIDKIGMREHLSPTRSNGLNAMIKQMKYYALAMQQQAS
ncbi:MAG: SufE family protein [Bacteroidota bacterium]